MVSKSKELIEQEDDWLKRIVYYSVVNIQMNYIKQLLYPHLPNESRKYIFNKPKLFSKVILHSSHIIYWDFTVIITLTCMAY